MPSDAVPDMHQDRKDGAENQLRALQREVLDLGRDRAYQQDRIDECRRELKRLGAPDTHGADSDSTNDNEDEIHLLHTRAYFTRALFFGMIMASGSSPQTVDVADLLAQFTNALSLSSTAPPEDSSTTFHGLLAKAWTLLQQLQLAVSTLDPESFGAVLRDWREGLLAPPPEVATDDQKEAEVPACHDGMDVDEVESTPAGAMDIQQPTSQSIGVMTEPQLNLAPSSPLMDQDEPDEDPYQKIRDLETHITNLSRELDRERTGAEGARLHAKYLQSQLNAVRAAGKSLQSQVDAMKDHHNEPAQPTIKPTAEMEYAIRFDRLTALEATTKERIKELENAQSAAEVEKERQKVVSEQREKILREEIERGCDLDRQLQRECEMGKHLKEEIEQRERACRMLAAEKQELDGIIHDMVLHGYARYNRAPNGRIEVVYLKQPPNPPRPPVTNPPVGGSRSTQHSPTGPSGSRRSSGQPSARSTDRHTLSQPTQAPPAAGLSRPQPAAHYPLSGSVPPPLPDHAVEHAQAVRRQQQQMAQIRQQMEQHYPQVADRMQRSLAPGQAPRAPPVLAQHPMHPPPNGRLQNPHSETLDPHLGNLSHGHPNGQQSQAQRTHPYGRPSMTLQTGPQEVAALYENRYPLSPSPPLRSIHEASHAEPPIAQAYTGVVPKQERTATPIEKGISSSVSGQYTQTGSAAAEYEYWQAAVTLLGEYRTDQATSQLNASDTLSTQPPQPSAVPRGTRGQSPVKAPPRQTATDTNDQHTTTQAQAPPPTVVSAAQTQVQRARQLAEVQSASGLPQDHNRFWASVWKA